MDSALTASAFIDEFAINFVIVNGALAKMILKCD
jgi:hypothetical protein